MQQIGGFIPTLFILWKFLYRFDEQIVQRQFALMLACHRLEKSRECWTFLASCAYRVLCSVPVVHERGVRVEDHRSGKLNQNRFNCLTSKITFKFTYYVDKRVANFLQRIPSIQTSAQLLQKSLVNVQNRRHHEKYLVYGLIID